MTYRPQIARFPTAYDIGDGGDGWLRVYGDEKVFEVLQEIGVDFCDGCGLPDDCVCPPNDNDNELGEPFEAMRPYLIDLLQDAPPVDRCSLAETWYVEVGAWLSAVSFFGVIVWALTR